MNPAVAPLVLNSPPSDSSLPSWGPLAVEVPGSDELMLQEFLEARGLLPGEATNVLIAVLQSLAEVHALGQVSGRIRATDIWLSETGEARTLPPRGHLPGSPAAAASAGTQRMSRRVNRKMSRRAREAAIEDCQSFVDLCHQVFSFSEVDDEDRRQLVAELERAEYTLRRAPRRQPGRREVSRESHPSVPRDGTDRRPEWVRQVRTFAAECEAALFACAEPCAIACTPPAPANTSAHSDPVEPAVTVASETVEFDWHAQSASALADIDRAVDRILEADRASLRPRARVADLAARSKAEGARQLTRAASAVRSRVKMVIVSVSVVTVALVGSLSAGATASHTQSSGNAASDALVSSTPSSAAPGEATATPLSESSGRGSGPPPEVLTADDPRAAALVLLEDRDHCLSGSSAACLSEVDQFQSPLLAADLLQFASSQREGTSPTTTSFASTATVPTVEILQRTGGAALVRVDPWHGNESQPAEPAPAAHSKPASLLLVKGETGWRLREVFLAGAD